MTEHKYWKGLNLNAVDKSIRNKLSKDERRYLKASDLFSIDVGFNTAWLFFVLLPWLQNNTNLAPEKILTDYHLLVPLINIPIYFIYALYQEKILKRFISSTLSQGGKEE